MTNIEAIHGFLTAQLAAAARTLVHARQLHAEARQSVAAAAGLIKGSPLPEMHAAHRAICQKSQADAATYLDHAVAALKTAQERLDAHRPILEAEKAAAANDAAAAARKAETSTPSVP